MTLVPSSEMTCASLMYSSPEIQMAVIVLQVCVCAIWHTGQSSSPTLKGSMRQRYVCFVYLLR